jgi:hypothetical protein
MKNQLTDEAKKELLQYLSETPFLMSFFYDINLLPEQISDEPLKLHYMLGMVRMYQMLHSQPKTKL